MEQVQIPLLDLARSYKEILPKWFQDVNIIAKSGQVLNGPYKAAFEEAFAKYLGAQHVVGVSSGTDAMILSLRALGIGRGDEVITHANTFIAVVNAIVAVGATPVLVDMMWDDFGPEENGLRRTISSNTRAIIVSHLLGVPVDMSPILVLAQSRGTAVIEDVAHSPGAELRGRKVGSFGSINAFSFGPLKNFAAFGDAGAVATNDYHLYQRVKSLADYGRGDDRGDNRIFGVSNRMDEIQAAWLLLSLRTLDERNNRRRQIYSRYASGLENLDVGMVHIGSGSNEIAVFHKAPLFFEDKRTRNSIAAHLKRSGISTGVHYPKPLHKTTAWRDCGYPDLHLPRSEDFSNTELSIPIFPELTDEEVDIVISGVRGFFKG